MFKDKFDNYIYQNKDVIELMYNDINFLDKIIIEDTEETRKFESLSNLTLNKYNPSVQDFDLEEFDKICQSDWFIPDEYKTLDIEKYLISICPKENFQRLVEELQEYKIRNLISLLKALKYLVDTLIKNNVIWGVGRGSSVSSYVLYLLKVHKIDSIKYNLDWKEFLR